MSEGKESNVEVMGAVIAGMAQACADLRLEYKISPESLSPSAWYPWQVLKDLERDVACRCKNAPAILEQIGVAMMRNWYLQGPGKSLISCGVDFLIFQSSSRGYASVVRGPLDIIGDFTLVGFDAVRGTALIRSTTPFDKDMERGIIIGGMSAPGDLKHIRVDNSVERNVFFVEYR